MQLKRSVIEESMGISPTSREILRLALVGWDVEESLRVAHELAAATDRAVADEEAQR